VLYRGTVSMSKVKLSGESIKCKPNSKKNGQSDPEVIRKLILGDVRTITWDRYGRIIPDDDAGEPDLKVLMRLHALHPTHGAQQVRNLLEDRAPWMTEDEKQMMISDHTGLDPRYLRIPELREMIQLSLADRERLGIKMVRPIDLTDEEFAQYQKDRKNAKRRARRLKAGMKPRDHYESNSISQMRPWELAGFSRATWYRRRDKSGSLAQQPMSIGAPKVTTPTNVFTRHPCETGLAPEDKHYRDHTCLTSHAEVRTERKRA
jgi:hypothetical protein